MAAKKLQPGKPNKINRLLLSFVARHSYGTEADLFFWVKGSFGVTQTTPSNFMQLFSMQPSLHFDAERQASRRRIEDLHPADRFKLMFGLKTLAELEAEKNNLSEPAQRQDDSQADLGTS